MIEGCQTRLGAPCKMLRFFEVPRRISLGFAHSAAAAGNRRRVVMRTCPRPWAVKACRAEGPAQLGHRTVIFTYVSAVTGGEPA